MLKYIVLKEHNFMRPLHNTNVLNDNYEGTMMKVKMSHSSYMARKVATDLFNSKYIQVPGGVSHISEVIETVIKQDIQKEVDLEDKINTMMDKQEDSEEFEYMDVNYGEVFWMVKRRLAKETGFELNYEDRYNDLSHQVVDELWKCDAISYDVSDIIVKNIIFDALFSYLNEFAEIEKIIERQISNYKRDLIPGTEDYYAVYERLYLFELKKHGLA